MVDQHPNNAHPSEIDDSPNTFIKGLGILPQNLLSLAVGGVVRARLPRFLAKPANKLFVKAFSINMAEAEKPLGAYGSIEDVFTRKLQPGSRHLSEGLVSPADGCIIKSEAVHVGRAIQAKGISYSMAELVFGQKVGIQGFDPAWFSTIYLAPHNYHRVHTPISGTVDCLRYIPGRLWPVNGPAVRSIPNLFCRNERVVFDLKPKSGGRIWIVMVGAFNVGRIITPLKPDFVSNSSSRQFVNAEPIEHKLACHLDDGAEIGTFMLGSTVILVFDKEAANSLKPGPVTRPRDIRMGQSLSV